MSLFQLDPLNVLSRVRSTGAIPVLPSLAASVARGAIGFTLVSIAGFLPWPIMDHWFSSLREMHLYIACTVIFVTLSGPCLHRLILGPGSLPRFYKLFSLAFVAYVIGWVACWTAAYSNAGALAGLLAGTAAMGAIFAFAFDAWRALLQVVTALFLLNTAGYYAGGWIEGKIAVDHRLAAIFLWAICYGLGFGAGLGAAFHFCQSRTRELLRAS